MFFQQHKNIQAVFIVALAFLFFNIGDGFVRYMGDPYHMFMSGLFIMLFCMLFALIFSSQLGGLRSVLKTHYLKLHIVRALCGSICFCCFFYGIMKDLTFAQCYTLLLTSPFWVVIISHLIKHEGIGWHRVLSIVAGFIGVVIVMRPSVEGFNAAGYVVIIGAIAFALFVIFSRKIGEEEPLINFSIYSFISDICVLALLLFLFGGWSFPQPNHIPFFAAGGLFFFLGAVLSAKGFSMGDSTICAPLHYTQVIWGIIIGYFFFQESPEIGTYIGSTIIICSGVYLIYKENKVLQKR